VATPIWLLSGLRASSPVVESKDATLKRGATRPPLLDVATWIFYSSDPLKLQNLPGAIFKHLSSRQIVLLEDDNVFYFSITPHAMRLPELPDGSVM
jgi:hypothetical protein